MVARKKGGVVDPTTFIQLKSKLEAKIESGKGNQRDVDALERVNRQLAEAAAGAGPAAVGPVEQTRPRGDEDDGAPPAKRPTPAEVVQGARPPADEPAEYPRLLTLADRLAKPELEVRTKRVEDIFSYPTSMSKSIVGGPSTQRSESLEFAYRRKRDAHSVTACSGSFQSLAERIIKAIGIDTELPENEIDSGFAASTDVLISCSQIRRDELEVLGKKFEKDPNYTTASLFYGHLSGYIMINNLHKFLSDLYQLSFRPKLITHRKQKVNTTFETTKGEKEQTSYNYHRMEVAFQSPIEYDGKTSKIWNVSQDGIIPVLVGRGRKTHRNKNVKRKTRRISKN